VLPSAELIALFAGFIGSGLLVLLVREAADRKQWVAQVNERSSHTQPTATLGGLGFVLPVLAYLFWLGMTTFPSALTLACALLAVTAVSLFDDLKDLSRRLRFLVHLGAVAAVVWTFRDTSPVWLLLIAGFLILWHLNLFNFMDGIDGLAASQALFFCLGAQVISTGGIQGWLGDLSWLVAGCMIGFLVYNWPKASIFMGDVGSGFLGLLIGGMVLAGSQGNLPFVGALILLAGFWFDATYTLCVRIVTGQKFTHAHKSHLYQRLAARKGHRWTTCVFWVFGLVWLLPLAWLAGFETQVLNHHVWSGICVALAVAPLAIAAPLLRTGLLTKGRTGVIDT
jgi:Fuc2NAc and GlcNAc transferase